MKTLAAKMMTDVIAEQHKKVLYLDFDDARSVMYGCNALHLVFRFCVQQFAVARNLDGSEKHARHAGKKSIFKQ